MLTAHEYSIMGHSRATIGRYLGALAAWIAAGSAALTGLVTWAIHSLGFAALITPIVIVPVSVVLVYPIAHFAFDRFAWKYAGLILKIPDISGIWNCEGTTLSDDGSVTHTWKAKITISQTWEKIHVALRTNQ